MSEVPAEAALGASLVHERVEALLSSGERLRGYLVAVDEEMNCVLRDSSVDGEAAGEVLLNGAHLDALYPLRLAE